MGSFSLLTSLLGVCVMLAVSQRTYALDNGVAKLPGEPHDSLSVVSAKLTFIYQSYGVQLCVVTRCALSPSMTFPLTCDVSMNSASLWCKLHLRLRFD